MQRGQAPRPVGLACAVLISLGGGTGVGREQAVGKEIWSIFRQPGKTGVETMAACRQMIDQGSEFKLEFMLASTGTRVTANFRPAAPEALSSHMPQVGIPGFVPWQVNTAAVSPGVEHLHYMPVQNWNTF